VPNVTDWQYLNLNYVTKARIDQDACIKCGRCYAACEDTSHQAIACRPDRVFEVIDAECVACNLCVNVCPVENCITMEELPPARWTAHRQDGGRRLRQLDDPPNTPRPGTTPTTLGRSVGGTGTGTGRTRPGPGGGSACAGATRTPPDRWG
jgi:NAD-dependent dihydropyrimidine dehydrogenase PreA subunit